MAIMEYHLEENIAWLDMPSGENPLTPESMAELERTLKTVELETEASVLVLTSQDPKFFCNGFDLDRLQSFAVENDIEKIKALFYQMNRLFRYLLLSPLINIAAVNGHVFAAGAVLACACDYRVMRGDRGFFCLPEIDLGIPLLPSSLALVRKVTPHYLLEDMLYSGRRITGEEAEAHHLVHRTCSLDKLKETTLRLARSLDKKRDHIALMKRAVNRDIIELMDRADPAQIEKMISYINVAR